MSHNIATEKINIGTRPSADVSFDTCSKDSFCDATDFQYQFS